jgi:hypothetical protein
MCNLYSHTKGPQAIRELARAMEIARWEIARELQKPPPAGALKVVRRDAKED